MKVSRRLSLRGNALYICIPKAMAAQFHWGAGDVLIVEAIGQNAARVRPIDLTDMSSVRLPSLNLELPRAAAK